MSTSESIKVTARIRPFLPWESDKQVYTIQNETDLAIPKLDKRQQNAETFFGNTSEQEMISMTFNNIYDKDKTTEESFNGFAKALCDKLLESGCNSLMIAYGQTGSGKTYTLLGNPGKDDGAKGILTMSIEYLMKAEIVTKCWISAKEVYATNAKKVEMFDLFDPVNATEANKWHLKKGKKNIAEAQTIKHELKEDNINKMICLAQTAGHYAPTGKNPQSSRGHIMYLITLKFKDGRVPHFICCDLAGSEGATAITPSFIAKVGKSTAKVRMMEGGAINYGLTQIRDLLKEVGSNKGCGQVKGTGLRFLLWPYVQKKNAPAVSVLFTISPSITNYRPTLDTFRTCKAMAALKIKAIKVVKKVSSEDIILNLKAQIREQQMTIRKLQDKVASLEGTGKLQKQMRKMNNEGVVRAHIEDNQGGTITQEALIEAGVEEKEDGKERQNAVEYNLKDLEGQRVELLFSKKEMKARLKDDKKNPLLRKEYKQILKELENLKKKIDGIKELNANMKSAISKDQIKNLDNNNRISMFLVDQLDSLIGTAEDVDKETIKIRKSDLMGMAKDLQSKNADMLDRCVARVKDLVNSHGKAEQREAIKLNEFVIQVSGHEYIPTLMKNLLFEAMAAENVAFIEEKICKMYMNKEPMSEIAFRILWYLEQNAIVAARGGNVAETTYKSASEKSSD